MNDDGVYVRSGWLVDWLAAFSLFPRDVCSFPSFPFLFEQPMHQEDDTADMDIHHTCILWRMSRARPTVSLVNDDDGRVLFWEGIGLYFPRLHQNNSTSTRLISLFNSHASPLWRLRQEMCIMHGRRFQR